MQTESLILSGQTLETLREFAIESDPHCPLRMITSRGGSPPPHLIVMVSRQVKRLLREEYHEGLCKVDYYLNPLATALWDIEINGSEYHEGR